MADDQKRGLIVPSETWNLDEFEQATQDWQYLCGSLGQLHVLKRAQMDARLDNPMRVLLVLIMEVSDRPTGLFEIDREAVAEFLGISLRTVQNKLSLLASYGYIMGRRARGGERNAKEYQITGISLSTRSVDERLRRVAEQMMLDDSFPRIGKNLDARYTVRPNDERTPGSAPNDMDARSAVRPTDERTLYSAPNGWAHAIQGTQNDLPAAAESGTRARFDIEEKNKKERKKESADADFDLEMQLDGGSPPPSKTQSRTSRQKRARGADDVPADIRSQFEEFWKAYPASLARKGGKTQCLLAFWDITRGEFISNPAGGEPVKYAACKPENLIKTAKCFAVALTDRKYAPGVMVWFNGGKWEAFLDWESEESPRFTVVFDRMSGQLVRKRIQ